MTTVTCDKCEILYEALVLAHSHLEYCNYGDAYERECAKGEKL